MLFISFYLPVCKLFHDMRVYSANIEKTGVSRNWNTRCFFLNILRLTSMAPGCLMQNLFYFPANRMGPAGSDCVTLVPGPAAEFLWFRTCCWLLFSGGCYSGSGAGPLVSFWFRRCFRSLFSGGCYPGSGAGRCLQRYHGDRDINRV